MKEIFCAESTSVLEIHYVYLCMSTQHWRRLSVEVSAPASINVFNQHQACNLMGACGQVNRWVCTLAMVMVDVVF